MADTSNSADIIELRDLTERFEELDDERTDLIAATTEEEAEAADLETAKDNLQQWHDDNDEEYNALNELLGEMKGCGGDHKWRGDWYPGSMIRDSYFEDYAQELAADIFDTEQDAKWPYTCIDWEKAARELQTDYSSVEYDGITYWYR
jgi:Antirestriction protein (ArdA)